MFKRPRIIDQGLLERFRKSPCQACGLPSPSDPAHIKSRGAGGDDVEDNLWALCRACHVLQGTMGIKSWYRMFGRRIEASRRAQGFIVSYIPWATDDWPGYAEVLVRGNRL